MNITTFIYNIVVYKTATEDQLELEDLQKIFQIRSERSFFDLSLTGKQEILITHKQFTVKLILSNSKKWQN